MRQLKKILHVDDDEDTRAVTRLSLELVGHFVVEQCASGNTALETARAFSPDLFLLDAMMPNMSGEETLRELHKVPEFTNTPAIFLTVKAEETAIKGLMKTGAIDVITKPFDPVELGQQINAAWDRFQQGS